VDGGSWSADRRSYEIPGLAVDMIYSAEVPIGTVRDDAGNLAAKARSTFRTQARQPLSGDQIPPPGGLTTFVDFDATSDSDGVVSVAARAVNGSGDLSLVFGRFDPGSGAFTLLRSPSAGTTPLNHLQVVAAVAQAPEAPRISAFAVDQGVSGTQSQDAFWAEEGASAQASYGKTYAVVPTPSGCAESATEDPPGVGLALDASGPVYRRPPNPDVPLPFVPQEVAIRSPDEWEWLSQSGSVIQRQLHLCHCDTNGSSCDFVPASGGTPVATDAASVSALSVAAVPGRRLYVYDHRDGNSRTEACFACVTGTDTAGGCPDDASQVTSQASQHLRVAPGPGQTVIGARLTTGSPVGLELVQRDLSQSCSGNWSVLGKVDSATDAFRPVMFGDRPGLLYLRPDGRIGVFIP
jgi:hypothetical protein